MEFYTEHKGSLFDSDAPAIGHGINCKGVMGAGIAKLFRDRYPRMYDSYRKICMANAICPGECFCWVDEDSGRWIMNIASQYEPGANAKYTYLIAALVDGVIRLRESNINRLAIPQIGCGIGGLEWQTTKHWIKKIAEDYKFNIEVWSL